MLRDARDETSGATLTADVCIAGAGAAGITIARELERAVLEELVHALARERGSSAQLHRALSATRARLETLAVAAIQTVVARKPRA